MRWGDFSAFFQLSNDVNLIKITFFLIFHILGFDSNFSELLFLFSHILMT